MKLSLRTKLTLGYTLSMATLLFAFVAADVVALQDAPEAWRHALTEHGLLALAVTVGIALVSYYVVGRAFRPVQDIVHLARTISAEDLSRRIEVHHSGSDELGELVATLNDMIGRLDVSFSQVARFSADAAHELKTPLAVLHGQIELALRQPRDAAAYEATLAGLLTEVGGLNKIVDNLLFLARSNEPSVIAAFAPVALDQIALQAFEAAQTLAEKHGVRLDLGTVAEVTVEGDETLLQRMVANVLDNAIEHCAPDKTVRLSLAVEEGATVLSVDDEGEGIATEHLERVFERLYRVDASRSKKTGGAGLGLAIVKRIATLHGCAVRLESIPGSGTRVAFVWK